MAQTQDVCGRVYRKSRTTKRKPATSRTPTSCFQTNQAPSLPALRIIQCHRLCPLTRTVPPPLSFSVADVSKTFKRVNPHKAAGPDGIPSRVLRACADKLAGVLTDIFNRSLSQSAVPTCFKMATIVPVPKKAKLTELNDYRPIALTSVIMKCFERLVKDHITSTLPDTLDPLQFAYRPNRSTRDAIAITLP